MKIRIILADDQRILREALRSLIENDLGMTVVGQAENGRITVELVQQLKPDVVIMDLHMPEMNGVEATRKITTELPAVKVIALSMHYERELVLETFRAGAAGYLLKDCAGEELGRAIHTVLANKTYVSPEIASVVIGEMRAEGGSHAPDVSALLTPKEREVLQLLAEGKSIKEIASLLCSSIPTVETHKLHLMEKLNIHSIAELTKFAIRHGVTSLE